MSERKFRLGTVEQWGSQTCGYGLDPDPQCTKPATVHVMFFPGLMVSLTCDEHLAFIERNAGMEFETHTVGANCSMPGSLWHHPYEDEDEGYCLFPAPDDASLLIEEPVPAVVSVLPPGADQ